MDSWLWDPPIYSVEDNFQSVFSFWHEPDPAENDAANEKACIQVLRILITKADTDITELEDDIILLQSQLAWTDESWSELCFFALREKIKFLDMSIKGLTNKNLPQQRRQQVDFQLQVPGEPAEKIHVVLKRLLEKYSPHKHEQHKSSNVDSLGISQSKDETRLINSVAEICRAKTSSQTTTPSSLEAQKGDEEKKNSQNKGTMVLGQLSDVSSAAFEEANQRDLNETNAESNSEQGSKDQDIIKAAQNIYSPEYDEHAIAVLRNASGLISSYEADSNSVNWGGSNHSEGSTSGEKMPSYTDECTIFNSSPKSRKPTPREPYKLAGMTSDVVGQLRSKSITKPSVEEEGDDRANKANAKRQMVTMGKIGTRSLEMKKSDKWPNDGAIAESFPELLNKRKETTKPEMKGIAIPQLIQQMKNSEVIVPKTSESNLLLRHEIELRPYSLLEAQAAQKPHAPVEMEVKPPAKNNLQNRNSKIKDRQVGSTSANRNFRGQTLLDFRSGRVTSDFQSEKKRRHSMSPVMKENKESRNIERTSGMHNDAAHGMTQKDHMKNNSNAKSEAIEDKHFKSLSGTASMDSEPDLALEVLPMDTLRKLAKVNNLTGYSKLRKEELVKLLKAKSRDGDWREI